MGLYEKKIGLRPGRASVDPGPAARRDEIKIGCGELEGMIGGRQTDRVSRAELKGGQFLEFGDRVGGGENVRSAVGGGRSHRRVGEVNHSRIEALVILIEGRDVDFVLLEVGLEVGTDRGVEVCNIRKDGTVRVLLDLALNFELFGQLIDLALERQRLVRLFLDRLHLFLRRFHSVLYLLHSVVETSYVSPRLCKLLGRYGCVGAGLVATGLMVFLVIPAVSFLRVGFHPVLEFAERCLFPL